MARSPYQIGELLVPEADILEGGFPINDLSKELHTVFRNRCSTNIDLEDVWLQKEFDGLDHEGEPDVTDPRVTEVHLIRVDVDLFLEGLAKLF